MQNFKIKNLNLILLFLFGIYYFYPLLNSGFIGDDAYNSQILGRLFYEDLNIFEFCFREAKAWYWNNGRFYPISICVMYFLFYLIQDVLIIKFFYFILIILNLIVFFKVIKFLTDSSKTSILFCILVISSMQLRLWGDPIMGFHGLMQTLLLFFLISIYFFLKHQKKKYKKKYETLSLIFYFLSLITYEVSYSFIGLFFIIDYFKTKSVKISLHNIRKYIFLFSSILIIVFIARIKISLTGENSYPLTANFFNIYNILQALFVQLFSSLNLTYSSGHIFKFGYSYLRENVIISDIIFLIFLFYLLKKNLLISNIKNSKLIILISLWLWVPPALIVSMSSHQKQLIEIGLPAVGYLPIYLQYFGTIILLYYIFLKLFKSLKFSENWIIYIFSITLTLSTYIHLLTNREVVKYINYSHEIERLELMKALEKGILNDLNDGDLVIREMEKPHDWIWFYALYSKKKLVFCDLKGKILDFCYPYHEFNKVKNNDKKIVILLKINSSNKKNVNFLNLHVDKINLNEKEINNFIVKRISYFNSETNKIKHFNDMDEIKIENFNIEKIYDHLN